MPRIFNLQRLILASAAFAIMVVASSTTLADPITITVGNPGNTGTDNVLFNNGSLVHSGLLVQGDFNGAVPDPEVVAEAWESWRREVAFAEEFVDATESLETMSTHSTRDPIALRDLLVHMIEEYARHCGHADLIRERIDGRTGQ